MTRSPGDMSGSEAPITRLLRQWQAGDKSALDEVMAQVHSELRRLARLHMRGEARVLTLQPTALVNEVYLRLAPLAAMTWRDRAHFFAMASRLMRRVLVDAARSRQAGKRGQNRVCVTFDDARMADPRAEGAPDVLALNEALTALSALDARKAQVVELRFFGGLTVEETAEALGISPETIARDWRFAKLWLRRALAPGHPK
jgi:RNA polymerase sigma-70 factor, ECF subfamily